MFSVNWFEKNPLDQSFTDFLLAKWLWLLWGLKAKLFGILNHFLPLKGVQIKGFDKNFINFVQKFYFIVPREIMFTDFSI